MTCTCGGHANEPNPCPVCERAVRIAEAVSDELRLGKLDFDLGCFVVDEKGADVVAEFLQERRGGVVRVNDLGHLEWDTVASKYGWRQPSEFMGVRGEVIGEVYREAKNPVVAEFEKHEIERRTGE